MILYVILLFPLQYECVKMEKNCLKCLIIGILFTPIAGFLYKYFMITKFKQPILKLIIQKLRKNQKYESQAEPWTLGLSLKDGELPKTINPVINEKIIL